MLWEKTTDYFAEKSEISENLGHQIKSLSQFLEEVITEKDDADLIEDITELPKLAAKAFDEGDEETLEELKEKIGGLSTEKISSLLRYYTVYFHLINSLEQHEITRINRERSFQTTADSPRTESIAEAIYQLSQKGYSMEDSGTPGSIASPSRKRRSGPPFTGPSNSPKRTLAVDSTLSSATRRGAVKSVPAPSNGWPPSSTRST
jgi:hypothetical protein